MPGLDACCYDIPAHRTKIFGGYLGHRLQFGLNDGGASFRYKDEAKSKFMQFFDLPQHDPRRGREGLYHSYTWGPSGRRVQVSQLTSSHQGRGVKRSECACPCPWWDRYRG